MLRNIILSAVAILTASSAAFAETPVIRTDDSTVKNGPTTQTVLAVASFANPQIKAEKCTVRTGPYVGYNQYYGHSWLMHSGGWSYIEIEFEKPADSEPYVYYLTNHLSSLSSGGGYSPVSLSVNGQEFEHCFNPNWGNWVHDEWNISDYVVDGKNVIRISFCGDAATNYWINAAWIFTDTEERGRSRYYE